MAKPNPKEFRDDVVAVARKGREPLAQFAKEFGISEGSLATNWMRRVRRRLGALRPPASAMGAVVSRGDPHTVTQHANAA